MSTDTTVADLADPHVPIDPPTDAEEAALRETIDHLLVGEGSASVNGKAHVDAGDGTPRCADIVTLHSGGDWREMTLAQLPPGYKPLCRYCTELWRRERED